MLISDQVTGNIPGGDPGRALPSPLWIALMAVGSGILIRMALWPLIGDRSPFVICSLAVLVAARYGGRTAGILATVGGGLSASFLPLQGRFRDLSPGDILAFFLYLIVGTAISHLSGQLRDALNKAEESEKRHREIFEALPQLIGTVQNDGNCDYGNGQWTAYTGIPVERLRGRAFLDVIHPDDVLRLARIWRNAWLTGEPYQLELRLRRHDGTWRWFDSRNVALRDSKGGIVKWLGSNTDIQDAYDLREALRQETERFTAIAGAVPGLIYTYHQYGNRAGKFVYASPHLADLCGLSPEHVRDDATPFFERIHPDDRGPLLKSIRESAEHLARWQAEFRFIHPHKGEIWLQGISMPGPGTDGDCQVWCGVMTDVTERRRAQEMAREWQLAFEQSELAIGLSSAPAGTIRAVNRAFARERGFEPEELIGKPTASVYPPEEIATFRVQLHACDTGSGHSVFESVQLRKDGSRFPVLIDLTAIRDDSGAIVSRVAIMHDLTARKRIEERLQRSEALYREVSNNLPDSAVFVVGRDLRYQAIAGPLAPDIGYPSDKLTGRSLLEVLDGEVRERSIRNFEQALSGESFRSEGTNRGRVLTTHYLPLRDDTGRVTAAMAIVQDITAHREVQKQIRLLNDELEQRVRDRTRQLELANRELESFAWSVSHDLRAPLRGIDGWSEALIEDCGAAIGPEGSEYLGRIRTEAQRMGALIDGLLDLSRLSRSEMRREPVDLSAIARRHAQSLTAANPGRKIAFSVADNLSASGDERLLEIVIGNLMENAVKFTGPRAEAKIEFGRQESRQENRQENDDGGEFFVRDNGVGFDMAHSSHLFGAFQRLHKASEFPGTGIGLATVQRVVHRHGGSIRATAAKGEGATFYFALERESASRH